MGSLGEGTLAQLRLKALRLMCIGRGEDDVVPDWEAGIYQGALVIRPGIRIGLGVE